MVCKGVKVLIGVTWCEVTVGVYRSWPLIYSVEPCSVEMVCKGVKVLIGVTWCEVTVEACSNDDH